MNPKVTTQTTKTLVAPNTLGFIPSGPYPHPLEKGLVRTSAPSNIALIKYWGKKHSQIPANPSLSLTLTNCRTITSVFFEKTENTDKFQFELYFDNRIKEDFYHRIEAFFKRISPYVPFLKDYKLTIETGNTFPHSSGIASSASGMAALALAFVEMEKQFGQVYSDLFSFQKASFLARLGSGSASRSLWNGFALWGPHPSMPESSELYAIPLEDKCIHPVFKNYRDTILLVSTSEKEVSSSLGHQLMKEHPFRKARVKQANEHLTEFLEVLKTGDIHKFAHIVETEALTLHALMMTGNPYYILIKPETLAVIEKVWAYRKKNNNSLCFTLDAGANVHLLYSQNDEKEVKKFIETDLIAFCENKRYISDYAGKGACLH